MAEDKSFNEKPMIVVVADGLDPRVQRQLKAQLHSEMMSISQIDAEIKNQAASENIKQQMDSVKDESSFDENAVKDKQPPEAIEDTPDSGSNKSEPEGTDPSEGSDPFTGENNQENGGDNKQNENNQQQSQNNQQQESNTPDQPATPASDDQNNKTPEANSGGAEKDNNGTDPFTGEANASQNDGGTEPPPKNTTQPNTQQPQGEGSGKQSEGAGGEDPFTDDSPTFEAFAGILGLEYKSEDASPQTKEETPPLKQLVYIRGTDQGVDRRTSAVVAALADPQNTVAIIDLSDVGDVEPKMEFSGLKKQLQGRGVTVVETVEQAVDFLNDVYDQISGGSSD